MQCVTRKSYSIQWETYNLWTFSMSWSAIRDFFSFFFSKTTFVFPTCWLVYENCCFLLKLLSRKLCKYVFLSSSDNKRFLRGIQNTTKEQIINLEIQLSSNLSSALFRCWQLLSNISSDLLVFQNGKMLYWVSLDLYLKNQQQQNYIIVPMRQCQVEVQVLTCVQKMYIFGKHILRTKIVTLQFIG